LQVRARTLCVYPARLTAPLDFTALQRQTFPPAVRIAHRARAPGIKMTAHWILRTGPTAGVSAYDTNSPLRR